MQIYISKNGQQHGPFEEGKVLEMLKNGQLSPNDMAIRPGQNQWLPLGNLFPQVQNVPNIPQFPINNQPPFNSPPPGKKGGSAKILLFALLGIGGLLLVGIIAIAGLILMNNSKKSPGVSTLTNSNSNPANSNSPKFTPTPDYNWLESKALEFSRLKPTLKLDAKPTLKGKIAVIEQHDKSNEYSAHAKGISDASELADYGLTKEKLPTTIDELNTIVQIVCGKGREVGKFGPISAYVPAYANSCQVSIIDYKESKIISQKIIENGVRPKTISVTKDEYQYILPMPREEIQKYIKSIPIV